MKPAGFSNGVGAIRGTCVVAVVGYYYSSYWAEPAMAQTLALELPGAVLGRRFGQVLRIEHVACLAIVKLLIILIYIAEHAGMRLRTHLTRASLLGWLAPAQTSSSSIANCTRAIIKHAHKARRARGMGVAGWLGWPASASCGACLWLMAPLGIEI